MAMEEEDEGHGWSELRSNPEMPSLAFHDDENLGLSTTIDPSYIIRLIRQILPQSDDFRKSQKEDEEKNVSPDSSVSCEKKDFRKTSDLSRTQVEDSLKTELKGPHASCNENLNGDIASSQPVSMDGSSCNNSVFSRTTMETVDQPIMPNSSMGTRSITVDSEKQEEAGCVLWDLAASESHANFVVENHILEVLVAVLSVSQSDRMKEICLGILGNLACHNLPGKAILRNSVLVQKIVESLFLTDSPILTEACRILSAGLHSDEAQGWVEILQNNEILERILWITSNTMNPQLLEKSTELLLSMVDSEKEFASTLVPPLVWIGLPGILSDLVACEVAAIVEGMSQGDAILDTLLRIGEALSLVNDYASLLVEDKRLFVHACDIIRLSEKYDLIGTAGLTATVLIANLLAEEESLIVSLLDDSVLVNQILYLVPSVDDDPGAQNALWSIFERIFKRLIVLPEEDLAGKTDMVAVLANGCDKLIEDVMDEAVEETSLVQTSKFNALNDLLQTFERWRASGSKEVELIQKVETVCNLLRRHLKHLVKP